MQHYIETEGDTVEEAIEHALTELEATRDQVTIDIVSEPTKGILNFGAKPAKVRATLKQDVSSAPETILKEMLNRMGIDAEVESSFVDGSIHLNIATDSPALLIGKHGQTLDAIERLLNCIVNKASLVKRRVFVNTEGYRERREERLVEMAHQVAEKVRYTDREVVLAPMSARDRRIIHVTLKGDEIVSTYSQGEGEMRRVVVTTQQP
ncbi:protein jag [Candidatus Poribacteria bacterium]|nr:protein jag [Candidatus Poribacteria bacterium]MXV82117.1 protein jag [Candidatus Poribacteria bacterium]MYA55646.1 protein jag [Candidatus Poribacteria bacterium]